MRPLDIRNSANGGDHHPKRRMESVKLTHEFDDKDINKPKGEGGMDGGSGIYQNRSCYIRDTPDQL